MVASGQLPNFAFAAAAFLAVGLLGGCSGAVDSATVYRDLADIPERPAVTPMSENEQAVDNLADARVKTIEAAEDLRREAVTTPAPAPPLPMP